LDLQTLEALLDELIRGIQDVIQSGETLSDEFQGMLAQELDQLTSQIDTMRQQEQPTQQQPFQGNPQPPQQEPQGIGAPPSPDAQLLWMLAGQQEDAFMQYLQEYSTPETQALLRNPAELERIVQFLHAMMPSGQQPVVDGMQHADLNSSTIWGHQYNPSTKKMKVRFQGGSEYEYDNIPANIYRAFSNGDAAATTNGQNDYGKWWISKRPSLGASLNQYIKQGGFNYRRLN
jgi:flagellin-like hook-associated protein FlgL